MFLLQNSAGGWVQEQRAQNSRRVWGLEGGGEARGLQEGRGHFPFPMEEAFAVLNVAGNDFAVWMNDSKMAARECDPAGPSKVKGVDLLPHSTACLQNQLWSIKTQNLPVFSVTMTETNFRFKHTFWSVVDRNNAASPDVFFSTGCIRSHPGWSFFFFFLSVSWTDDAPSSSSNTIFLFPWFFFFLQRKDKRSCLMADLCRRAWPQGSVWVVGREWLMWLPDCPKTVFPLMERLR